MTDMYDSQYERFNTELRIRVLQIVILVTFLLLVTGLVFFQIVKSDEYVSLASQNRLRILRVLPPRGNITDAYGAPLAVNVRTFNVNGYPIDMQKEGNLKKISALLQRNGIPMDEVKLEELIQKQYSALLEHTYKNLSMCAL